MVLPSASAAVPAADVEPAAKEAPPAPSSRPEPTATPVSAATIVLDGPPEPSATSLIQPRNLSPEYARRVTAAWKATKSPFQSPRETLNSSSTKSGDPDELLIGTRSLSNLDDSQRTDYELTEVIGEGNMGTVWSARQSALDRVVAIKIPKRSAGGTIGREQFISEVVVTGQLDHPNIVPIYDLARDESGQLFYSMKRIEGRSWDNCMHEAGRSRQENVEVLMKVCDAIRFAHDRGVIHRDIKPQNIMIGKYGEVSVMDWGIALRLDSLNAVMGGVVRLSPAGTPAYMAPEMATANPGEIGPHTDVYLLGAVLYEVITGEPPHPPPLDSHDRLVQQNACLLIAARNVISPASETGELIDIACKAMATDISKRYQTVEEFQDAIRNYLSHSESIALAERGQAHLANAQEQRNGVYEDYAKARFAYGEAIQLWPENPKARGGLDHATVAYAGTALKRGDYALGLSLLTRENPAHLELWKKLNAAKRKAERNRFMAVASGIAAACFLILGIAVSSFFAVRESRQKAIAVDLRDQAEQEAERARLAEAEAVTARNDALTAKESETEAKNEAIAAKNAAEVAQRAEEQAKNEALAARNDALEAKEAETEAKNEAQVASYRSEIGLAAEEVQRNAFDVARSILNKQASNDTQAALRSWEWGHLMHLARDPSIAKFEITGMPRVEAVAMSPDQKWVAAGTDNGEIHVWWHPEAEKPALALPSRPSRTPEHAGPVSALALASEHGLLVTVRQIPGEGDDVRSAIQFWELPVGDPGKGLRAVGTPLDYSSRVLSVALSPDGQTVLAGASDSTAQLWSRANPNQPPRKLIGHLSGPVWQASFSPDGSQVVTAGDDGSVRTWNARTGEALRKFEGHRGPVYTAAFSPDGKYVVSGGRDRRLLAWDLESPQAARVPTELIVSRLQSSDVADTSGAVQLGEHTAAVRDVSFAPDGKTVYTASHDNSVGVWDVSQGIANGRLRKSLRGHGGWVRSCAAAADGRHVLSGSYDGRVYLWDWQNYAFPRVLRPSSELSLTEVRFTSVAATADARWVATAAEDGAVTVWDMRDPLNPDTQLLVEGHEWQATTGVYFRDGSRLLTAGGDNAAVVWDTQLGNQVLRIGGWNTTRGSGWRGVAAASHAGQWFATGSDDPRVLARLWDAESGQLVASLINTEAGQYAQETERTDATAIAFAPGDETVCVADQWGNCYLFRTAGGALQQSFHAHDAKIVAVSFLPDGRLLTASSDGTVARWPAGLEQTGEAIPQPDMEFVHGGRVVSMDVSSDGNLIITATDSDSEAVLRVWNAQTGEPVQQMPLAGLVRSLASRLTPNGKPIAVRSVALHASLPQAIVTVFDPQTSTYQVGTWHWNENAFRLESTGLRDTSMAIYAPNRNGAILTVGGRGARLRMANRVMMSYRPQPGVNSVSFSPDNQLLAVAGRDGTVKLWRLDAAAGKWSPDERLAVQSASPMSSVAFHPARSDMILTASADGAAKIWELQAGTWQANATLADGAATGAMNQAVFSQPDQDGTVEVVTASDDGNVRIWSVTGQKLGELPHDARVQCLAISPDRKWIVTGVGSEALVWDRATLQKAPLPPLVGHSAEITSLAFTSDGARLLTGGRDFNVKLWDAAAWAADTGETGQQVAREILTLEGHTDAVMSITFLQNGDNPFVLTAGSDGQAILWPSASWGE
jgi:WD40 repeat protein